jgi:hypothetical protein
MIDVPTAADVGSALTEQLRKDVAKARRFRPVDQAGSFK